NRHTDKNLAQLKRPSQQRETNQPARCSNFRRIYSTTLKKSQIFSGTLRLFSFVASTQKEEKPYLARTVVFTNFASLHEAEMVKCRNWRTLHCSALNSS
ncbi:hypothetical protein, partial [Vogesella sp. EB]|uniref:hypothetical protein n=1 Tax=Vogesella sp. EB TaxID=1526735 RepID=UPI001EE3CA63